MCIDPGSITAAQLLLASQVATTAVQFMEADSQASAQDAFNRQQEALVQNSLEKDRAATARQYEEINQVSMDDSQQRYKEYLIESARLKTIGAESGLSGVTQERIEQEASNNASTDLATIEANRMRQNEQAHSQAAARASNSRTVQQPVKRPSMLGAGLQIAGAGVSYQLEQTRRKATTQPAPSLKISNSGGGS